MRRRSASSADHVATVSNTGGDGKERIGVAMLDRTLTAAAQAALNTGKVKNERMFLVAHKSTDDAAAAAAGVIAGYEPHISMLLKPIKINHDDAVLRRRDRHARQGVRQLGDQPGR